MILPQRNGRLAGRQDDFVDSHLGLGSVALETRAAFAILARFQKAGLKALPCNGGATCDGFES